jgi:hypothetical protein
MFAIFGVFYDFKSILQVVGPNHNTGNNLYARKTLELLNPSQIYPWLPPLGPDGDGKLAGGEVERGQANK